MSVFITTPHEWIEDLMRALVVASQDAIELSSDSFDDLFYIGEATGCFLLWGYHDYPDTNLLICTIDDIVQGFHLQDLDYGTFYQFLLDIMHFHYSTLQLCVEQQEFHKCEPVIRATPQGWRLVGWHLSIT